MLVTAIVAMYVATRRRGIVAMHELTVGSGENNDTISTDPLTVADNQTNTRAVTTSTISVRV